MLQALLALNLQAMPLLARSCPSGLSCWMCALANSRQGRQNENEFRTGHLSCATKLRTPPLSFRFCFPVSGSVEQRRALRPSHAPHSAVQLGREPQRVGGPGALSPHFSSDQEQRARVPIINQGSRRRIATSPHCHPDRRYAPSSMLRDTSEPSARYDTCGQ